MKKNSMGLTRKFCICLLSLGMWGAGSVTTSQAQSMRELFRRANSSVVVVHARKKAITTPAEASMPDQSIGSGFLISEDGKVLTAAHVIQTADQVEVEFSGGQRIAARILTSAPFADVALLQLEKVPANATVARLGDSSLTEIGDQIFMIGTPYGAAHTLSVGWVSALRSTENAFENLSSLETLQLDAAIYEGNSGGPVFNLNGEVIGIVSHALAKVGSSTGLGFAVTSNIARKLLLEENRVWLGIEGWLIEGELANAFNLPQSAGMMVQSVASGSLGAALGLREGSVMMTIGELHLMAGGDIIVEMLGQPIVPDPKVLGEIQLQLNKLRVGDTLKMKVWRSGKIVELTAQIPK